MKFVSLSRLFVFGFELFNMRVEKFVAHRPRSSAEKEVSMLSGVSGMGCPTSRPKCFFNASSGLPHQSSKKISSSPMVKSLYSQPKELWDGEGKINRVLQPFSQGVRITSGRTTKGFVSQHGRSPIRGREGSEKFTRNSSHFPVLVCFSLRSLSPAFQVRATRPRVRRQLY